MNRDVLVNERIRAKTVRLVDDNGKQNGVFLTRDAIARAKTANMDLVQIGDGDPPVCRIMDSGKYLFERKKQLREQARRQRELAVEIKEIQLRPVTDTNDLLVKSRRAREFLDEGDKVKIVVRFRGRERAHKDIGVKVVEEFLGILGEHKVERPLVDSGREMQMILAPTKSKAELFKDKHQ